MNLSPTYQRTNPGEQAQDPPTAKPQTPQPETKRLFLTDAQYTQRRLRQRRLQLKPHSSTSALQKRPKEITTRI